MSSNVHPRWRRRQLITHSLPSSVATLLSGAVRTSARWKFRAIAFMREESKVSAMRLAVVYALSLYAASACLIAAAIKFEADALPGWLGDS